MESKQQTHKGVTITPTTPKPQTVSGQDQNRGKQEQETQPQGRKNLKQTIADLEARKVELEKEIEEITAPELEEQPQTHATEQQTAREEPPQHQEQNEQPQIQEEAPQVQQVEPPQIQEEAALMEEEIEADQLDHESHMAAMLEG